MDNEKPSFYSFLTADVRYDPRLKNHADEKVLFSEITALSNKYGFCNASNGYFAKNYERPKQTISKWINHLRELGYLKIEIVRDGKQIIGRRMYAITTPINANVNRGVNASVARGIGENVDRGINVDVKDNITSLNTIKDNITDSEKSASASPKVSKKQLDEDFAKLWKIYPVKKEKQVARKKYEKAIRDGVTNKQIQDGIVSYIREIKSKGTSKQYIKHGGTWFSQRCWEDEYETGSEQRGSNPKDSSSQDKMVSLKAKIQEEAKKLAEENEKENASRRARTLQDTTKQAE